MGTMTYLDSSVYDGFWSNNKQDGNCVLTDFKGVKFEGCFKEGRFLEGSFINGNFRSHKIFEKDDYSKDNLVENHQIAKENEKTSANDVTNTGNFKMDNVNSTKEIDELKISHEEKPKIFYAEVNKKKIDRNELNNVLNQNVGDRVNSNASDNKNEENS